MKIMIIAGGSLDKGFCLQVFEKKNYDKIIAVDRGLKFLHENHIVPDLIVGDFDSLPGGILAAYEDRIPIRRFNPQKDASDMEIGVRAAIEMGADDITILGGTGTRIDHVIGNIQTLMVPLQMNVEACIADANNRIRLLKTDRILRQEELYGEYVSFFPLTTTVEGLTLQGFKYPLSDYTLTSDNSLGVSNEVTAKEAVIRLKNGVLIMIESRD